MLEVCDGKVLIELNGANIAVNLSNGKPPSVFILVCWSKMGWVRFETYSFLVLPQCRMYHAHIEKYLGCIRNLIELCEGFVELIIVVVVERSHPRLDFLQRTCENADSSIALENWSSGALQRRANDSHTCLRDILTNYSVEKEAGN